MTSKRKDQIYALLKGIETGDPSALAVVNEDKYIQHNPHTHEGNEGLAALFERLSKTSPRVDIVRIFEDEDFVFAHTRYDFSSVKAGFEIFRFEKGMAVEHWDNLQPIQGPNPSGHGMLDGYTEILDFHRTASNRDIVLSFVNDVLIRRQLDKLDLYINTKGFTQHNPQMADGLPALRSALSAKQEGGYAVQYDQIHHVLAEGNFVLCASEGYLEGVHSSIYDLFRLTEGKLVEHWDTIEAIPPRSEWKNNNGKF